MQEVYVLILDDAGSHAPPSTITDAADDVWQAFRALWAEGVLHGDVHPGNVVLRPSIVESMRYDVKILDLGNATCFRGPVPPHIRQQDEAKLLQHFGPPS